MSFKEFFVYRRISIHALREEGDKSIYRKVIQSQIFLSTPSARRATASSSVIACEKKYFYPRPPRGGRRYNGEKKILVAYFYPRPPRGGRRNSPFEFRCSGFYFYPRPPRGGRHGFFIISIFPAHISIHALREEGDIIPFIFLITSTHFYPRPPRGGRQIRGGGQLRGSLFLSTPSARRATL